MAIAELPVMIPPANSPYTIRLATTADEPALRAMIPRSARALSHGYYTAAQAEAAITHIFGLDTTLLSDGTYFVVESPEGALAGCGGWSRRRTLYGGNQHKAAEDPLLDPATDAARIRAFFVSPEHARRGVGALLLTECVRAAGAAGFQRLELMATLPGVPLYEASGFRAMEAVTETVPGPVDIPFVRMERLL
jgi:GNAT superfamily N-acetyltransferase